MRPLTAAALIAATFLLAPPVGAQTGEALIQKLGASTPVPNPSFPADKTVDYKVVWDVNGAPATPGELTPGMTRPAGFLVMADANGLDRKRVHLALIVYGGATNALLANAHYKAATGVDNPNIPLLQALNDAGVQVIVCGQALAGRKIPREQLLPFVKVATSATMARATLHAQGYATFMP